VREPASPGPGFQLDHVALAVHDIDAGLDRLIAELGATIISGEEAPGFRYAMLRVGDAAGGMNLEVLAPWQTDRDDFLARFLERHGDGPHHITFRERRIEGTLATLRERGIPLARTSTGFAPWQETFISPAHGSGTVIQIAGSSVVEAPMSEFLARARAGLHPPATAHSRLGCERHWWRHRQPVAPRAPAARLERIVVGTNDLQQVRELFVGVLGGNVLHSNATSLELDWRGSGRIRFEAGDVEGIIALDTEGGPESFRLGSAAFRRASDEPSLLNARVG
jgi:catechol 2,3-dioxygenase-like lactoylglutathione lyase family enzyme